MHLKNSETNDSLLSFLRHDIPEYLEDGLENVGHSRNLDHDCQFVVQQEWTEYTEFLEQGCDAALFVGMHARAGTRDVLAEWVTSPDNPYFARAAVNRIWARFFGNGLIDPVDGDHVLVDHGRRRTGLAGEPGHERRVRRDPRVHHLQRDLAPERAAIGLAVAVPAVLGYNWLIRRNKTAMDNIRSFGADLHAVLLSAPKSPARG